MGTERNAESAATDVVIGDAAGERCGEEVETAKLGCDEIFADLFCELI